MIISMWQGIRLTTYLPDNVLFINNTRNFYYYMITILPDCARFPALSE
jgi:hypothetical protein